MKTLLIAIIFSFNCYSQKTFIKLNTKLPQAGQEIILKYSGKLAIEGSKMFVIIHNSSLIDGDIKRIPTTLKKNKLIGKLYIPDSTSFFVIKVENKNEIDNNEGKGYGFNIYNGKKPIKGTYFTEGYFSWYNKIAYNGEINFDKALKLIETDYLLYPEQKEKTYAYYLQTLARIPDKNKEAISLAKQKFLNIFETGIDEKFSVLYAHIIGANNIKIIDSLVSKVAMKYPRGASAFNIKFRLLQNNKFSSPDSAIQIYNEIKDCFPNLSIAQGRNLIGQVLWIYAFKNDLKNVENEISIFLGKERTSKEALNHLATKLNDIAWKFSQNDSTMELAKIYAEKSVQTRKKSDSLSIYYGNILENYAAILYKLNKKELALEKQRIVMALINNNNPKINQHFIEYLMANKQYAEAKKNAKDYIITNVSNFKIDSLYKELLIINGNINSKENLNEIKSNADIENEKYVKRNLFEFEASSFILKDLDGRLVQLSDFTGDILILDFWATWCKPCIKSFSAMNKLMIELTNQNVKFLFIDTFEEDIERDKFILNESIRSILKIQNVENFRVVIDPLIDNINQTANNYNVTSIPTKIVIDKNGKIRYKSSGFTTEEDLIKELKNVIKVINDK
jgi:thiol-disulfide isomerase/thioredoxin